MLPLSIVCMSLEAMYLPSSDNTLAVSNIGGTVISRLVSRVPEIIIFQSVERTSDTAQAARPLNARNDTPVTASRTRTGLPFEHEIIRFQSEEKVIELMGSTSTLRSETFCRSDYMGNNTSTN